MHKKQQLQKEQILTKKAFSLLESAIVLAVVAVMIVVIVSASGLVTSSKVSVARSLSERSPVPKIDGLVAWYDATSLDSISQSQASDGVTVASWYDVNPASIPSVQNTLTNKTGTVSYVKEGINKVPSLQFSSYSGSVSNFQLSAFSQGTSAQNTVFIVFKQQDRSSSPTGARYILDSHSSAGVTAIGYQDNGSSDSVVIQAETATRTTSTGANVPSFKDNDSFIMSVYYDRGYTKAYVNNSVNPAGNAAVATPGSNLITGLTIGSLKDDTSATRFVGLISEIIIYDRVLKNQERKDIFEYLSKKYSISIVRD